MKLLIVVFIAIIIFYNSKKGRLLSSSSIWVACYLLIFVVYPLHGAEETPRNGGLIDTCALIGVLMFLGGIIVAERLSINKSKIISGRYYCPVFKKAFVCFVITSILTIVDFMLAHGPAAIIGVLLGTMTSKEMALGDIESAGLGGLVIHLVLPCALAVLVSAKSRGEQMLKRLSVIIFSLIHLLFCFTRIFLITYLAIVLIYEIRSFSKRKQFYILSIGLSSLTAVMVSLNYIRCYGFGDSPNFELLFDLGYVFESTDFGASYTWFDRLLSYGYPDISILTWLKPVYAVIPRSIWPGKPEPLSLQILQKVDPDLVAEGYSTAGNSVLGEGYAIIGYLGILVFPFLWGVICTILDRRYYFRLKMGIDNNVTNIVYYLFAVFVILSAQRGDWSQYMTIFIYFWWVPLIMLSKKSRYIYGC